MAKKKKQTSNHLEVQNSAKTLFANIRFMSVDEPIRSLVITSSVPNEGKTTVSVNLAQSIATSGKRVLLVEADMRRRSLAAVLGVRAPAGTYAVLTDAVALNAAVVGTSTPNLYLLDTEPNIPNPADMIASKRFKHLSRQMLEQYDYVIYDTPPVSTFVDAAILSTLADATVLVVRPNHVKRSQMMEAYEQLQKADANVIGICATDVEGTGSEYYYAYYTADGKRARPADINARASVAGAGNNQAAARGRGSYAVPGIESEAEHRSSPTPHVANRQQGREGRR